MAEVTNAGAGIPTTTRRVTGRRSRLSLALSPAVENTLRGAALDAGLVTKSRGHRRGNITALMEMLAGEIEAGRLRISPPVVQQN